MCPDVSVVIPLYNKAPYVKRCVTSVLSQTVQGFEVVVVDDGSTDGGPEMANTVGDPRIKIARQANAGVSAARNKGVGLASADLIAFLDADDDWEPFFLETVLEMRDRYPEAGAYVTAHRVETGEGTVFRPEFPLAPREAQGDIIAHFGCCAYIYSSAIAVRKEALGTIGGFPIGVRYAEDLDTWIRLALSHPVAWSSRVCATSRASDSQFSCRDKTCVGDAPFVQAIVDARSRLPRARWRELYELLCSQRLRTFAVGTYLAGHAKEARAMVWECVHTRSERKRLMLTLLLTSLPVPAGRRLWNLMTGDSEKRFLQVYANGRLQK